MRLIGNYIMIMIFVLFLFKTLLWVLKLMLKKVNRLNMSKQLNGNFRLTLINFFFLVDN